MNPPASGSSAGPAGGSLRALAASPALALLLLGALTIRLTIAYVLFPGGGFESDLGTYQAWALRMASVGPDGFYAPGYFSDYPPGYLLVLWPIGLIAQTLGGGDPAGMALGLIKLPPMLMDIAVGWLLYRLVLGWTWPGRRAETLALGAAALYLFNPVTFYDSALWGQTDAAGALVLLLCVAALVRGNAEGATALAVVAAMIKPQFGVVAIPLVAVVLLRRHLLLPGSGPRQAPWGPAPLRGWFARHQGPSRLVTSAVVGLVVFSVIALPFVIQGEGPGDPDRRMWVLEYLQLMGRTAGGYASLSVNAYNPWALLGADGNPSLATAWAWSPDTVPLLGPVPGVVVGALLLVAGFGWFLARTVLAGDRWTIILAAAGLCMAFFILPTRVHERYLFPAFAFLPLLAVADRRWLVSLVVLAVGSFINLHGILMIPAYATDNIVGLPLGDLMGPGNFTVILLAVVLQTGVFAFGAWDIRRRRAPDPFELAAGEVAGAVGRVPVPDGARAVGGAAAAAAGQDGDTTAGWGPGAPGGATLIPVVPEGPSTWERIGARVFAPRLRRDRSASLLAERGGRLTRLDLGAMVAIFLAAMVLRGFNLAQPFDMYFDEVYHARTGLEFLQHWRYGEKHSIYEYTHPHLAKYAMAVSVDVFGDNKVTGTGSIGAAGVAAAALEPRWSEPDSSIRNGDRLFVATATGIAVVDLRTDDRETTIPGEATALVVNPDGSDHALYLAAPGGAISRLDTTLLDARRQDSTRPDPTPDALAQVPGGGTVRSLVLAEDGDGAIDGDVLVALMEDGRVTAIDLLSGEVTGTGTVPAGVDIVALPPADRLVARPAEMLDRTAAALVLADELFDDADRIGALLASPDEVVVLEGYLDAATERAITDLVDDGTLSGVGVERGGVVAVAGSAGAVLLDARTLVELETVDVGGPATGVGLVASGFDDPLLYIAGPEVVRGFRIADDGPASRGTIQVPGRVGRIAWNEPANLVHVLGETADGTPTVYVLEPHGDSLFADARLPFVPVAMAMDTQPDRPGDDRTRLIALAADGRTADVAVGGNAFAWRLPGVFLGALTAACLYLLARLLFRRRAVAVFAGVLALAEGMLFANSRIAMNDAYVTFFVIAALTLFLGLWLGRWQRAWQVIVGFVAIGVLLGLALASKWVAAYAIGGMALLVLLRSALGRLIALAGMLGLTAVLGAAAIRPAAVDDPTRNWLFLLIMIGLTLALAAAMVRRPVRATVGELVVATVVPATLGAFALVAGFLFSGVLPEKGWLSGGRLMLLGAAALAFSVGVYLAAWLGGRAGVGPLARRMDPDPDAPVPAAPATGWLRPGGWGFFGWLFALVCLGLVPVAIYVASYLPWAGLGNQLWPGFPAGNTGQALIDWPMTGTLTESMYNYHDRLRATHAASSPWWAWLLDLKPVWFYQEGFANDTTGAIYDTGNLVIFWMGIAGLAFCAWAAWTRRSLALTAVVLMFCAMWLPWARIDRATFQYHVYTSLPFLVLALAYLLAELWHGPSRVGWTVARVAAALTIVGAPLLWLLRRPLCAISGVDMDAQACGDTLSRTLPISEQGFAAVLVLVAGAGVLLWLGRLSAGRRDRPRASSWVRRPEALMVVVVGLTLAGLLVVSRLLSSVATGKQEVGSEPLALAALLLLAIPGWMALRARDPRRFAVGVAIAAAVFLIAFYPNLSGLPLPTDFANVYQGLLPTWNYYFQFAVNTDPPVEGSMFDALTIVIGLITLLLGLAVMIVARFWGQPRRVPAGPVPEGA